MKASIVLSLRDWIFDIDETIRSFCEKSPFLLNTYQHTLLPLETTLYSANDYKIGYGFKKELLEAFDRYLPEAERNDPVLCKKLAKDILRAYFINHMKPEEYFLYHFQDKTYEERQQWLSNKDRMDIMMKKYGAAVFSELRDKKKFYELAKDYFKREVCFVNDQTPSEQFIDFAIRQKRFIMKPLNGTLGDSTFISTTNTEDEAKSLLSQLLEKGSWIAEELIIQHSSTAEWNPSSVNSMRIPSFRTADGVRILQPFFRTGRKGSVVDNAGHGGIFAVFDEETGVITTDGVDEHGGRFAQHPDSGLTFKGWQIPYWKELKELTAEVHHSLPSHHQYVGFDFALTDNGWVLIEGNWGQMVGQMAELKGIRHEFIDYLRG